MVLSSREVFALHECWSSPEDVLDAKERHVFRIFPHSISPSHSLTDLGFPHIRGCAAFQWQNDCVLTVPFAFPYSGVVLCNDLRLRQNSP